MVHVLDESVTRPPLFAILLGEIEFSNRMSIERDILSINYKLMGVDPHGLVIMRDREAEYLSVQHLYFRNCLEQADY